MKVKKVVLGILLCVVATGANITVRAAAGGDEVKRVGAATTVLNEMMRARDKSIPGSILERAEAIAIFPGVKKAGFVIGGQWGRGIISVRDAHTRKWSSPAFLTMTGGSV
jgi:lipid-binding SYLF domain-containing protein